MSPAGPLAGAGLQQQAGDAHEAKDALVIDQRMAGASPGPVQQGRDASIAIGGSGIGDGSDLGGDLCVAGASIGASSRAIGPAELLHEVGAGDAERVCDGLHRIFPLGSDGTSQGFFWASGVEGLSEDLGLHGLAAREAFELADLGLEFAHTAEVNDVLVGPDSLVTPIGHAPPPLKKQTG